MLGEVPILYIAAKSLEVGEQAADCTTWEGHQNFSQASSTSVDNDSIVVERKDVDTASVEDP